jgi:hypothetical protein
MMAPQPSWDEILDEIEARYGLGIAGSRVDDGEVRFENRDDESTFRFKGPDADDGLWRLEEGVDEQVVRVVGDDWRTAIAHYEAAVETGRTSVGP